MRILVKKLCQFFKSPKELKAAERYIHYMEEELSITREAFDNSLSQTAKLKGKNDRLSVRVKSLRLTAGKLRDRIYSHGATQRELDFLHSCEDIYKNNKMISEQRFKAMVATMLDERERACINRSDTSRVSHARGHATKGEQWS